MRTPYQIYKEEVPHGQISSFNTLPMEESLRYRMMAAEEALAAHVTHLEENPLDIPRYAFSAVHTAGGYATAMVSLFPIMSRSSSERKIYYDFSSLDRLMKLLGNPNIGETLELLRELQTNGTLSLRDLSFLESLLQDLEQKMRHQLKEERKHIEMLRSPAPTTTSKMKSSSSSSSIASTIKLDRTESQERDAASLSPESIPPHFVMDSNTSSTQELPQTKMAKASTVEEIIVEEKTTPVKISKRPRKEKASEKNRSTTPEAETGVGKRLKLEPDGTDKAVVTSGVKKNKSSAATSAISLLGSDGTTLATCGRLRSLTTQEKKIANTLQQLTELLAHVYATKCNDLVVIFDFLSQKVRELEKMVTSVQQQQQSSPPQGPGSQKNPSSGLSTASTAAEEVGSVLVPLGPKPPPYPTVNPFLDLDLPNVLATIAASNRTFRADEECQLEFDEDLIHPIAYALVKELNRLEGFLTPPFEEASEADMAKKQAARAAAKQKREEARRKAEEKQKQKEAQAAAQARELAQLRQLIGGASEEEVVEEDVTEREFLPYVHYDTLPLGEVALFEKALYVWCMLTSIPKSLQLAKMPFSTFVQGLLEESESDNALMREVVQQMLNVGKEQIRSPLWSTRGKTWFTALLTFVEEASGNKKNRKEIEKASSTSSSSEEDLEEEEEEEEETAEEKPEAAEEGVKEEEKKEELSIPETPPPKTFEDDLRETLEELKGKHSKATWGNASLSQRLNLLQFCVSELLSNEKIKEEADAVQRDADETTAALEKGMREIRDEGEKELRSVWKRVSLAANKRKKEEEGNPATTEEGGSNATRGGADAEEEVQQILETVRNKYGTLYSTWIKKQDDEVVGCIIDPIGMDRFHRLYWRFPLDRQQIYVQTTADSVPNPPPLVPIPKDFSLSHSSSLRLLLDDEDAPTSNSPGASAGGVQHSEPSQMTWGVIPAHYLESYCKGLCVVGRHEGPLRRTLLALAPHLQKASQGASTMRTRSRSQMFGYANQLNPRSFFY